MLGAYVQGRDKVDEATLSQAAHEVLMGSGFERQYRRRYGWLIAGALVIVFGTALASTFYTGRTNPPAQKEKKQEAAAPVNLDWQVTQPVEQSMDLAFGSLFRQWNVPYQPGAGESACRHAQRNGLRCLHKKGSLRGLLELNRPAVLALSDEKGNTFHAALLSLAGETATVSLGKDTLQVPLSGNCVAARNSPSPLSSAGTRS